MNHALVALVVSTAVLAGCQSSPVREAAPLPDQTLRTAAASMSALQAKADVITHNLANAHTPGFKAVRLVIEELPLSQRFIDDGRGGSVAIPVGAGVRVSSSTMDMRQGAMQCTGRNLDIAIQGAGFFMVTLRNGGRAYSRAGVLSVDAEGQLMHGEHRVEPSITLPQDASEVQVNADGQVSVVRNGEVLQVGQLQLATFVNAEGLRPIGASLFVETPASGQPSMGSADQDGRGTVLQGMLESANVDTFAEQIDLARTQHLMDYWQALAIPGGSPRTPRRVNAVALTAMRAE